MSIEKANNKLKSIPVVVSGEKYRHEAGFVAIKDGIKKSNKPLPARLKKPDWLRIGIRHSMEAEHVKRIVKQHRLHTVCEEARCPNLNECWSAGTATVMLLGKVCTRACRFCSVDTGNPHGYVDESEIEGTADSVKLMGLKYVVITSVDRDDLPDGGAKHYADTVKAVLRKNPETKVEVLTPDFHGDRNAINLVLDSGIHVFAQNVETVKRLTHPVRDPRASYELTLDVLKYAKESHPHILVKTSLMLGLGETDEEILATLDDLKKAKVDIVTFGQYLQPTPNHLPVERYVTPEAFKQYRQWGLAKGFLEVVSGPMVRSSYRAEQALSKNNCNLPE